MQWFGWIPIYTDKPETLWQELGLLSIPAAAVGFRSSALIMRLTRSSMLEVMRQDYIRTARAKGASENTVNYDHALRNAVLPVITIIGIEAAFLIGGLIVTETVFNIPGVARFLVEAIQWRDYPDRPEPRDVHRARSSWSSTSWSTWPTPSSIHASSTNKPQPVSELDNRKLVNLETPMAAVDHEAELEKAGANVTSRFGSLLYYMPELSARCARRGHRTRCSC